MKPRVFPKIDISTFTMLSVVMFLISLMLPAFRFSADDPWFKFSGGNDLWPGFLVLLMGWFDILQFHFGWLANPVGFVALVHLHKAHFKSSSRWAGAALILALSSFQVTTITANEGGSITSIYSMGLGFYVWLIAISFIFLGAICGLKKCHE